MPKTLTIVNSVYHLLTAVNLRRLSPAATTMASQRGGCFRSSWSFMPDPPAAP